jgi:hypothetical protein
MLSRAYDKGTLQEKLYIPRAFLPRALFRGYYPWLIHGYSKNKETIPFHPIFFHENAVPTTYPYVIKNLTFSTHGISVCNGSHGMAACKGKK